MIKRLSIFAVMSVFLTLGAVTGLAQEEAAKEERKIDGLRGEAVAQLKDAAEKYLGLAKVTPDDKLGWRPAEGIRSNAEVWMHVANSNFLISKALGADLPADLPKDLNKVTDRKEMMHLLKLSFKVAIDQISGIKEEDLARETDFFGSKRSVRGVVLAMTVHCHNHLGQSVAYARMNGVKPPWAQQ